MPVKRKSTDTPRYTESTLNREYPNAYQGKTKMIVSDHGPLHGRGGGATRYLKSVTRPDVSGERTGGMLGALSDISKSVRGALKDRDTARSDPGGGPPIKTPNLSN